MLRRRAFGLVALTLLAQATLGRTAWACAASAGAVAPVSATDPHAHHGGGAQAAPDERSQPDDSNGAPHGSPTLPECCNAIAPCGAAAVGAVTTRVSLPLNAAQLCTAANDLAPRVRVQAPEPPPPKA